MLVITAALKSAGLRSGQYSENLVDRKIGLTIHKLKKDNFISQLVYFRSTLS